MKLIDKQTGETSLTTEAGGALLLKRGTHELADKPKAKPAAKKQAAAEETEE